MTHAALAATMSHRELVEWQAHYASEPRGEERDDWRFGWLAYVMASINARKGRRLKWADFVPFRKAPKEDEAPADGSDAQIKAALMAAARRSAPSPRRRV